MSGRIVKSEEAWRQELTPEQFEVMRCGGTERPGSGRYYRHHADGTYHCAGCGLVLFDSGTKYESGSGWPSFWQAAVTNNVLERVDRSHGMVRREVVCARCGAHLGHVFPDGPEPTGERYCINSVSLDFRDRGEEPAAPAGSGEEPAPAE